MHELYAMYERAHPVRLAGFLGLAGLLAAALYGGQFQILLAAVAILPVLFALTVNQRRPSVGGMALTLLGIYWIGFALAHAVLLRRLPHGLGSSSTCWWAYFWATPAPTWAATCSAAASWPAHLARQDRRGPRDRHAVRRAGRVDRRAYQEWLPGTHALVLGVGVALVAPVGDLFESFIKREARTKDSGHLFGAHGGALDRLDGVLFAAVAGTTSGRPTCIEGVVWEAPRSSHFSSNRGTLSHPSLARSERARAASASEATG